MAALISTKRTPKLLVVNTYSRILYMAVSIGVKRVQRTNAASTRPHMKDMAASTLLTRMELATIHLQMNFSAQSHCSSCPYPVVAADGITYERSAILKWLETNPGESAFRICKISSTNLFPNKAIKKLIADWVLAHPTVSMFWHMKTCSFVRLGKVTFAYVKKKLNGAVNVKTASDGLSLARRARLPSSWRFQQSEDHHFLIW